MPPLGLTLAIEASTYHGSVAVLRELTVVAQRDAEMRGRDEERLMPAVGACLEAAGVRVADLSRIVCGAGPGSFTSLRIAASIGKGICHAAGLPLFGASSLALIAASRVPPLPAGKYLASLDAMRGERYAAVCVVTPAGSVVAEPYSIHRADRMPDAAVAAGAEELNDDDAVPHARGVAALLPALVAAGPVDLGTWEPDYGRAPEAQVRWEAVHGRPLTS